MKNRHVLIALTASGMLLSSCSLFQKVQKNKDSLENSLQTSATVANVESEKTSSGNIIRYYGTTPEIQAGVLKAFEQTMFIANTAAAAAQLQGNTAAASAAMNTMSATTSQMMDLLKNGALGYEKSFDEKAESNKSAAATNQLEQKNKEEHSEKLKTPDYGALLIGGGIAVVLLIIFLTWQSLRMNRLSQDVNAIKSIFNAIKPGT